ncbi:hypothetical protein B0H10DRAFT_1897171, partial [Mycena sp. CBHHK59/15]
MLHIFHNIVNVWSDGLRHTILHNWLLNPTGKINAFVEVDLVQEHLNLWIKKIYKADGDAHSWDWLALVSPCVDVLHRLATSMNEDLGSHQGNNHTIPNLDNDIQTLMASLQDHEVYVKKEGQVLDDDEMPAPDVLSAGAAALSHRTPSNPLQDFNAQFDQLRRRRDLLPVSALTQYLPGATSGTPQSSSTLTTSEAIASAGSPIPDVVPDSEGIILLDGDYLTVDHQDDLPELVSPHATPPGSEGEGEGEGEGEDDMNDDEDLFTESPTLTRLDSA